jgi:hypothetical protein
MNYHQEEARPLQTTIKPQQQHPTKLPSKDIGLSPIAPHLTNPIQHHEPITLHPELFSPDVRSGKKPIKLPTPEKLRLSVA